MNVALKAIMKDFKENYSTKSSKIKMQDTVEEFLEYKILKTKEENLIKNKKIKSICHRL